MKGNSLRLPFLMVALSASTQVFSTQGLLTEEDIFAEIDSVTGVTHLKQSLSQVPAAVTIIDRRTIEASTALNLVDLFRLVPGFQVYYIHGNKPGVTYHVPGGDYSRRLEVKIDGRSVYESLLSSVEWNTIGVDIDDIEYIEVVRGSNTAADGSNAFIASFNIVTRSPLADAGTKFSVQHGNQGIKSRAISHSSQYDQLATRFTLKASNNEGFDLEDYPDYAGKDFSDSADTFTVRYQGLWTPTVTDSINFQLGTGDTKTTIGPSGYKKRHWKNKYQHFNWKRIANEWSDVELVLYHNEIDFVDNEDVWTVKTVLDAFDFNEDGIYENEGFDYPSEVQKLLVQHPQNEDVIIVSPTYAHFSDRWDAELRSNIYSMDNLRMSLAVGSRHDSFETELFLGGPGQVSQVSNRLNANLEWTASDKLTFNYGNAIEKIRNKNHSHSNRAAVNYQLSKKHVFRLAGSRSYRDPTLLELNQNSIYTYDNQGEEITLYTRVFSDDDIATEKQVSREIGYLGLFDGKKLSLDVRIFDEELTNLIGERREPSIGPLKHIAETINIIDNVENVNLKGVEWQLQYRPTNQLLLSLNHSYLEAEGDSWYKSLNPDDDVASVGDEINDLDKTVPENMANLLVSYEMSGELKFSGSYHYKEGYKPKPGAVSLPSHSRFDFKASKRWFSQSNWMELSLTAQNVGDDYQEHFSFNKFESLYVLGFKLGSN
ncbi:TonB-dependent receptor plug domain-containing protein [Porticoccaceae bacterium]|nr:TonB-dependent receptor plug domain-containing protein [Porticoccaceae bacterium]